MTRAAVAVLAFGGLGAFESGVRLFQDDFGYLMWGQLIGHDWVAALRGPEFFTYLRPLNGLVWWISAQTGIDGELTRWVQVALWTLTAALVAGRAPSSRASITAALLLLGNQVWIDLLTWRSWLGSTGVIVGMVGAFVALEAGLPTLSLVGLGLLTLGFKEVGALAFALALVLTPRRRWAGGLLVLAVAASASFSSSKLDFSFVPENAWYHLETLGTFASLVPAVLATLVGRWDGPRVLLLVPLVVLPVHLAGILVLVAIAALAWQRRSWAAPLAVLLLAPLFGAYHARQYLVELSILATLALASQPRFAVSWWTWLTIVAVGAPYALDFERHRAGLREEWSEQVAFLESFHPQPATALYHPDPMWSWDLDAIYWVQHGATLNGTPPAGTRPVQVGPRSGVWADIVPAQ